MQVGQLGNMSSQDKNTQNALFQNVYGQIENITSLVQNFQTQLDQVKSDQSAMSTDKVNLNVTAGWNKIIENSNAKSQAKWNEQFEVNIDQSDWKTLSPRNGQCKNTS